MLVLVLLRFVLNELIQTEKDYVKDLGIVVEVRLKLCPDNGNNNWGLFYTLLCKGPRQKPKPALEP